MIRALPSKREPLGGKAGQFGSRDLSASFADLVTDSPELDAVRIGFKDDVTGVGAEIARLADGADVDEDLAGPREINPTAPSERAYFPVDCRTPCARNVGVPGERDAACLSLKMLLQSSFAVQISPISRLV